MANMLMASTSTTPTPKTSLPPKPKLPAPHKTPILKLPPLKINLRHLTSAAIAAAPTTLSYLLPHPSLAEEIEKASLFDFNLTLPIIMAEFLILMFALDKIYFTPLGDFMDKRDASIKEQLADVKDTSSEVKQLEDQANAIMRAARAEISAALNKMKKETQAEVEAKIAEGRKKVEAELQEALASLEKQKDETIKALDSQIAQLSDDIVKKNQLPMNMDAFLLGRSQLSYTPTPLPITTMYAQCSKAEACRWWMRMGDAYWIFLNIVHH